MATINPSALGSQDATTNYDVCIELLQSRPVTNRVLVNRRPAGQLVGYYNSDLDAVELYVVNKAGNMFLKVV